MQRDERNDGAPSMWRAAARTALMSLAVACPVALVAQTVLPNSFVNGTVASATAVNDNFAALAVATNPPGTIIAYAGAGAPAGYLYCDGSTVSRATYPALHAALGGAWGTGNGTTTFHLPDLRGRFLRGQNDGSGRDPDTATRTAVNTGGSVGDAVGSVQTHQFASHAHTTTINAQHSDNGDGAGYGLLNFATFALTSPQTSAAAGGSETRPLNANVRYFVKY